MPTLIWFTNQPCVLLLLLSLILSFVPSFHDPLNRSCVMPSISLFLVGWSFDWFYGMSTLVMLFNAKFDVLKQSYGFSGHLVTGKVTIRYQSSCFTNRPIRSWKISREENGILLWPRVWFFISRFEQPDRIGISLSNLYFFLSSKSLLDARSFSVAFSFFKNCI